MTAGAPEYARVFDALGDSIVASDASDRIVYANAAAERLLGWPEGSLVGQPLTAMMPARMRGAHSEGFHRFVTTGQSRIIGRPVRVPALRKDGVEIDVELTLSVLRQGPEGHEIVALLRDLRDRVELERQLRIGRFMRAATEAAAVLAAADDPATIARAAVAAMVDGFDAALARVWLHDGATNSVVLAASAGLSTAVAESSRARIDLATYPFKVGVVARTRVPFLQNGLEGDPHFDAAWVARERLKAVACLPLIVGNELLGVTGAFFREPLEPEVSDALGTLAAVIAAALGRSRHLVGERAAQGRLALLAAAGHTLAQSLEYEETVNNIVRLAIPSLGDFGFLDVRERDGVRRIALAHEDPRRQALLDGTSWVESTRTDRNLCALSSGRAGVHSVIDDAWLRDVAGSPEHLELMRALDFSSMLTVPLRYEARTTGALTLFFGRERGRSHGQDDQLLAEELGRRAASAVENARLYRQAQEAIIIRDEFMSVASHELRTPLTSLQLHSDALLRAAVKEGGALPSRVLERARGMNDQVGRLDELVSRLLDVTRLTRSEPDLELVAVDLGELTEAVVARLREQMEAAKTPVRCNLACGVVGQWDRARLDQVVTNLLTNTMKYGGRRPVEVAVRRQDDHAILTVRDEGIGISEAEQAQIFERFARAVPATNYSGLGLGLWICRRIVNAMGGTIAVRSAPGEGSTFTVGLPLAPPAQRPPAG